MLLRSARRRIAALRQPGPSARLARVLWIAWAVVVWNVVFDRVIVVAGRSYIVAATRHTAADPTAPPLNMDDWMVPAVNRALTVATAAAVVVLVTGLAAVAVASRRQLRIRNLESGIREPVEGHSKGVGS
jgi:ABC-type Fe3+ transport system permease subunit